MEGVESPDIHGGFNHYESTSSCKQRRGHHVMYTRGKIENVAEKQDRSSVVAREVLYRACGNGQYREAGNVGHRW